MKTISKKESLFDLPTEAEKKLAKESSAILGEYINNIGEKDEVVFMLGDNLHATLPKKALQLLDSILSNMANGSSSEVVTSEQVLTTQQAANMLNVSRPYVVKLLEKGEIPFKMVGNQRRIILKDLMEYDKKLEENRQKQLDFIASEAQKLDLGY